MKTNGGIIAIILAAGESKRMQTPKMVLPFKGMTIIEKVIENVLASAVDKVLIVLGAEYEAIMNVISGLKVTSCYNKNYRDGMLSSVKCGFESLPDNFEAAIVVQGDQPSIGPEVINKVIKSFRQGEKGIVIPVYKRKRGHPVLISRKFRNEVEELDPDEGLRSLAGKFQNEVMEVEIDAPEILRDIDTREDYIKEINQIL